MNRYLVSFGKNRKRYSTIIVIASSRDAAREIAEHLIRTGGLIGREVDGRPSAEIRAVPGCSFSLSGIWDRRARSFPKRPTFHFDQESCPVKCPVLSLELTETCLTSLWLTVTAVFIGNFYRISPYAANRDYFLVSGTYLKG
jgi:hypothetical protein